MQRKLSTRLCKEVEHYVRSKSPWMLHLDVPVVPNEQEKVVYSITLWVLTMGDTISWRYFDARSWKTWVCNLADTSLVQANDFFKEVDDILIHSATLGEFRSRIRSLATYSSNRKALLAPLMPCIQDHFRLYGLYQHRKEFGANCKRIRSCLLFVSHLTLRDERSVEKSYQKYYDNLDRLKQFTSLPNQFQRDWIKEISLPSPFARFPATHGNGSVAEQRTERGRRMPYSEYDKWKVVNTQLFRRVCRLCEVRPPWWEIYQDPIRYSRLQAVMKGLGEWRIIGCEPADKQAIQHLFFHNADFRHTKFRDHCDLTDQSRNRAAAYLGSIPKGVSGYSQYACIDLSSASDSVRWNYVLSLFEQRPDWQLAFALARTQFTLRPDGSVVRNYHFAGMGSADTFIVECLVFGSIIVRAYFELGLTHCDYWVYGDDLVIDCRAYTRVVELLEEAGFVVNITKSFGPEDTFFREACGGHYIFGEDVYPVRLGRRFNLLSKLDYVQKLIDLCNRSLGLLPTLRAYGIHLLREKFGDLVPYTHLCTDNTKLLTCTDLFSMQTRRNKDTQTNEVMHISARTIRPHFNTVKHVEVGHFEVPPNPRTIEVKKDWQDLKSAGDYGLYKWFIQKEVLATMADNPEREPLTEPITIDWTQSKMQLCRTYSNIDALESYDAPVGGCYTYRRLGEGSKGQIGFEFYTSPSLTSSDILVLSRVLRDEGYRFEHDAFGSLQ